MVQEKPFRILSLAGGGVRGIFQAAFLRSLSEKIGPIPLYSHFDLIVGTSTGSIIGIAIALGVSPELIYKKYLALGEVVFRKTYLSWLRRGGRYNQPALRKSLEEVFGKKKLSDALTGILVTATSLDQYSHKTFFFSPNKSGGDRDLFALDIALASSAAPSIFPPVKLSNQQRTYSDGGLWANNPSMLGILKAHLELGVPLENIHVLSIGTGMFPNSLQPSKFLNKSAIDFRLVRTIINLFSSAQGTFSDEYSKYLVGETNYLNVNPHLQEIIELDDALKAKDHLPALAEGLAEVHLAAFKSLFSEGYSKRVNKLSVSQIVPRMVVAESGLTAFYPTRDHYSKFREGGNSISAYTSTAQQKLTMVSVNLHTGEQYEGIRKIFIEKLRNTPHFQLCISLLDPRDESLMNALAPALNTTAPRLADSIQETLNKLANDRASLLPEIAKRWDIGVHKSIPFGSAIIIDEHESCGRIQIETKPYKAPLKSSFAFEVAPTGEEGLFHSLVDGYLNLIKDGDALIGKNQYQPRNSQ